MLSLMRKKYETIKIGDDIEIVILDVRGQSQVQVGINAPRDVDIARGEIYKRKDKKANK